MASIKVKARYITAPRVTTANSDTVIWTDLTAGTSGAGTNNPILGIDNGGNTYEFNINLIDEGYTEYDDVEIGMQCMADDDNFLGFYGPKAYIAEVDFTGFTSMTTLQIINTPTLKNIILDDNLTTTITSFEAYYCDLTGVLDLSAVTNFTGNLTCYGNQNLTGALFATSIAGYVTNLRFDVCNLIGTFDISAFSDVANIYLGVNPDLTNIIFTDAQNTAHATNLYLQESNLTGTLDVSGFTKFGVIQCYGNWNLEGFVFADAPISCTRFDAYQCNLKTLDLSNFNVNTNDIDIQHNYSLTEFINPTSSVVFINYAVQRTGIENLDMSGLSNLAGIVNLSYNINLKSITFPTSSQVISYVTLNYNGIEGEVDLSGLTGLRRIQCQYSVGVTALSMPATAETFTEVLLTGLQIESLDLSGIPNMTNDIKLYYNQALKTIIWPTFSGNNFAEIRFGGNAIQTDVLDFSGINNVTDGFTIDREPYLKKFISPSGSITSYQMYYNIDLEEVDLSTASALTGVMRIYYNKRLKTFKLPATNAGAIVQVNFLNNYYLQGVLDFSNFTNTASAFTVNYSPFVDVLIPTSGTTLTNAFTIFSIINTATTSINLSQYTGTFTTMYIYRNPNLTNLQIPSGTCTGTLQFEYNNLTSLTLSNATALMTSNNKYLYISGNPMPSNEVQNTLDQLDAIVTSGPTGRRVYMQNMQFSQAEMDTILASAAVVSLQSKSYIIYSSVV